MPGFSRLVGIWANRLTFMSRLTGQSSDHEKPSYELPGALAPVRLTTNCWKAKTFSFSFDFFQKQVTLDRDLSALSNKNEETLAGQVAHPGVSRDVYAALHYATLRRTM